MKGIHHILIQNKRVRYEFDIRRNITVIRGDSATGKTTLIDMIRERIDNGEASSVDLNCDKECYVIDGATWKGQLSVIHDGIVFIDEGNPFVSSAEFSRIIRDTDNYYVIVSRESLPNLPYSVDEVYGIRSSGRYGRLKQTYHEFHRIYGDKTITDSIKPNTVIVEDSNSGFQFFDTVCNEADIQCLSAEGKSNIHSVLKKCEENKILIIADGAAFGSEMDRMCKYMKERKYVNLYLPESFEWIILKSGIIEISNLKNILEVPSDYIESSEFFSWEQFFTRILTDNTQRTHMRYTKSKLNESYLSTYNKQSILDVMDMINLKRDE